MNHLERLMSDCRHAGLRVLLSVCDNGPLPGSHTEGTEHQLRARRVRLCALCVSTRDYTFIDHTQLHDEHGREFRVDDAADRLRRSPKVRAALRAAREAPGA